MREKKQKAFSPVAAQSWAIWQCNNDIVFKNIYFSPYSGIVNRKLLAEVVAREIVAKGEIQDKHLEVEVIFAKKNCDDLVKGYT